MANNLPIKVIRAYYTGITPEAWPAILSWTTMRQFWGSQELCGEIQAELPETTHLKEFVALNARTEWFERFLSRYPNLKVVEM